MRPRLTASSTTSWRRSRERVTLRSSASRNASHALVAALGRRRSPGRALRPARRAGGGLDGSGSTGWRAPCARPRPLDLVVGLSRSTSGCSTCRPGAARSGRHESSSWSPRDVSGDYLSSRGRGQRSSARSARSTGAWSERRIARPSHADLPRLGRPWRSAPRSISSPRTRRWSMRSRARSAREAECAPRARRTGRSARGRRLRSPPRISGASPAQSSAALGGAPHVGLGAVRGAACVQVRDAEPRAESGEGHRRAAPGRRRSTSSRRSMIARAGPPDQREVRAALPGADQVGIPSARARRASGAKPVARGERAVRLGAAGARPAPRPSAAGTPAAARRPTGAAREHRGELVAAGRG